MKRDVASIILWFSGLRFGTLSGILRSYWKLHRFSRFATISSFRWNKSTVRSTFVSTVEHVGSVPLPADQIRNDPSQINTRRYRLRDVVRCSYH
jgi:hypothetical protein